MSISKKPSPTLAALRAGQPVVVDEFKVPLQFRDHKPLHGVRLQVLPDDRIEEIPFRKGAFK